MSESLTLFEMEPVPTPAKPAAAPFELPDDWEPEIKGPAPKDLEVVIDQERVDYVLGTLLDAYDLGQYPYNQDHVRLPHDPRHMPKTLERGTRDHAMLLWNVCYYMRGGIKSVDAFKRLSSMYDDRPDLFKPELACKTDPAEIADELKQHGLGFQGTVSQQWVVNSQRLTDRYEGDPRKIFTDIETYDDCLALIKNQSKERGFIGFQEKMTSMITYYLMDEGMIQPFMFPIPVDLHVMRVSIANKMVTFPNAEPGTNLYTPELLATLRKLYVDYAIRKYANPLRLCDAVWMLSESSCGTHPGNVTLEPFGRDKRNGRSTILIPKQVDIEDPRQQAAYDASCRSCPLEETCEYNIPGKQYYVAGGIVIRGRRTRFPLQEIAGPEGTSETLF